MAGRGRPLSKARPEVQLSSFVKLVDREIKNICQFSVRDRQLAQEIALDVLNDVQRTHPTYNNYSGNLNRSYMATYATEGAEYSFMTDPESVPKPQVADQRDDVSWRNKNIRKATKRRFGRNTKRYFYITVQRHSISRRGRSFAKKKHDWNKAVREVKFEERGFQPHFMHQYVGGENVGYGNTKTPKYRTVGRIRNGYSATLQIQNRTPYAPYVEGNGYVVINRSRIGEYRRMVSKKLKQKVNVRVGRFCKAINRENGRFASNTESL